VTTSVTTPIGPATTGPAPAPRPPAGPPATAGDEGGWRRSWKAAGIVWLAVHVAYAAITVLNRSLGGAPAGTSAIDNWLQWDGWHYYVIATAGYDEAAQDPAFYPLYPLLMLAADPVLPGGLVPAALVLSNIAGLAGMVVLHRLGAVEFGGRTADRAIYYLGAFPTAYFLAAPYNHAVLMLLSVGCLYALRRQAWWVAGALGALASGTRSAGLFLAIPFAYEYLRRRGFQLRAVRADAASIALVPVGLVAYAAYCWATLGDPLAFSKAQGYWDKALAWPGQTLWLAAVELGRRPLAENYALIADLTATLGAVAVLVLCFVGPWRLPREQWYLLAYAVPVLLVPLFLPLMQANPVSGMARYILDLTVIFLLLARIGAGQGFERLYVFPAMALQFGFLLMYLRGDWTF
jgi:hypothetical protein